jgi:hypothetical protein
VDDRAGSRRRRAVRLGHRGRGYGDNRPLRGWLEDQDTAYVLAVACHHRVPAGADRTLRADELAARLTRRAWQRLAANDGGCASPVPYRCMPFCSAPFATRRWAGVAHVHERAATLARTAACLTWPPTFISGWLATRGSVQRRPRQPANSAPGQGQPAWEPARRTATPRPPVAEVFRRAALDGIHSAGA